MADPRHRGGEGLDRVDAGRGGGGRHAHHADQQRVELISPNAMPSAPSTICAAKPTAMNGRIASTMASRQVEQRQSPRSFRDRHAARRANPTRKIGFVAFQVATRPVLEIARRERLDCGDQGEGDRADGAAWSPISIRSARAIRRRGRAGNPDSIRASGRSAITASRTGCIAARLFFLARLVNHCLALPDRDRHPSRAPRSGATSSSTTASS